MKKKNEKKSKSKKKETIAQFLLRTSEKIKLNLPDGYKFDRDEANER